MKKWIQKAIVQKTISYLPFKHRINFIFQKYVTRGVNLSDEYFYDRLSHARDHLAAYKKYKLGGVPSSCLEIGTGWYPIVPVCFFLAGAKLIYSVDIFFHTSGKRIATTLQMLIKCHEEGVLGNYIDYKPEKIYVLRHVLNNIDQESPEALLRNLNIHYLIEDARKLSLEDNSIDLVNSNNTFEHIYPEILSPILSEFKRVVKKPGGLMSHFIDMSDHFAHFDTKINIYNFLRYSGDQWKWIDNSIQPQNRLRIYEYIDMFGKLTIPITEKHLRNGNVEELLSVQIHENYKAHLPEETAISHCHLVCVMEEKKLK
jgi:hypothetical protein